MQVLYTGVQSNEFEYCLENVKDMLSSVDNFDTLFADALGDFNVKQM